MWIELLWVLVTALVFVRLLGLIVGFVDVFNLCCLRFVLLYCLFECCVWTCCCFVSALIWLICVVCLFPIWIGWYLCCYRCLIVVALLLMWFRAFTISLYESYCALFDYLHGLGLVWLLLTCLFGFVLVVVCLIYFDWSRFVSLWAFHWFVWLGLYLLALRLLVGWMCVCCVVIVLVCIVLAINLLESTWLLVVINVIFLVFGIALYLLA